MPIGSAASADGMAVQERGPDPRPRLRQPRAGRASGGGRVQTPTVSRWRQVSRWYDALSDRQRILAGIGSMALLFISSLYCLGLGSTVLVLRAAREQPVTEIAVAEP